MALKNKIKPVYVMNQEGLDSLEKRAVLDGITEILRLAGVESLVRVADMGEWRHENLMRDGELRPFHSIDWYIEIGRKHSIDGKLDGEKMLGALTAEPWRRESDHYDVMIVKDDITMRGFNFLIGVARPQVGTVISTARFKELDDNPQYECIKTETMHEFGHVLWLPYGRTHNIELSTGPHCTNVCVMRQGMKVPEDWLRLTNDRIEYGALCSDCYSDLRRGFRY